MSPFGPGEPANPFVTLTRRVSPQAREEVQIMHPHADTVVTRVDDQSTTPTRDRGT
jgi:hypothetical protein